MPSFLSEALPIVIYFVVFGCVFFGVFWMRRNKREGRFPLGKDVLVMRRAGEHLNQELARMNDAFAERFAFTALLPPVCAGLPLLAEPFVRSNAGAAILKVSCLALSLAALIAGMRRLSNFVVRMRDTKLGLFGERVVGDCLEALREHRFQVFHDVPCLGAAGPFNLDHVVIGNGAVTVVETKTYRKRGPEGKDDHRLSYEGQQLVWPDRESTQELEQVTLSAAWLRKELKTKLNLDVPVFAALTFPGWFINGGPPGMPVLVENPKRLPSYIRQRCSGDLTPEQCDLITRHLRSLTTNVDFEML